MADETDKPEKFEKLVSKRDDLLQENLEKQIELAKKNLLKEAKKRNSGDKPVSENSEPIKQNSFVLPPPKEAHQLPVPNPDARAKLISKVEKEMKKPLEKKIFSFNVLRNNKKVSLEKAKASLPPVKVVSKFPEKNTTPTREILEKEMAIDRAIARDLEDKKDLDKRRLKRHHAEETLKKEIKERSRERTSVIARDVNEINQLIEKLKQEMDKAIVGQDEVINAFVCALLCDGHVLLEGVPGIAKTLIVKTLAEASGCSSNRIQFTVDLLPSDILGITTYTPQKGFETIKGPIFSNFIVADEINRSPPKTQSAMIEAMQEKQVTIGKQTFKLPIPFFVMANNNPLEVSGVYELPEAQIDRFLFKVLIDYPKSDEEKIIMEDNMTLRKFESFNVRPILSPAKILRMQKIAKEIYVDDRIKEYIVNIVEKTRKKDFEHGQYIEWGGSPRASIGLYIASKAWALMQGREYVIPKDVKDIAHLVLRHRIILNYRARAEKLTSDQIIDEILDMIDV